MSLTPPLLYCSEWGCQPIEASKSYPVKAGGVGRLYPWIPLRCIWATLLGNPVRETARYGLYRGCRVTGIPTVEANALACLTNREVVSFERGLISRR